jgi:general stress protein CsbA
MTIARMLLGVIGSQVLFVFSKLLFINVLNVDNALIRYGMWVAIALIAIAIVRRMGVLNYLENIFLIVVWLITSLTVDFLITTSFTGREVYGTWYFWLTYLVMILAMFIFHKKSHVELRRMMAEQNK